MSDRLVLNRNVDNFFAETEQAAFSTQNIVPGIDFTNDPLLQGRNFSYLDTQVKRLGGPNFTHLPINAPKFPFHSLQHAVTKSADSVAAEFKEHRYPTKTRGDRTGPAAPPAGAGVYALVQRGGNLHLIYELELPERPGEVQQEFEIPKQAAYILSIANPEKPAPPSAGLSEREEAHYPKALQREFEGRRFANANPRLLDYEGAEFILIGARTDPESAYDIDIDTEHQNAANADIFRQLKMSREAQPIEPLFEGKWR